MWTYRVLEEIEQKKRISEIQKSLALSRHELRAAVRTLKMMGFPLVRKGDLYEFSVPRNIPELNIRTSSDLLTIAKESTKMLRFVYGEDVRYLWPRKVLRGKEEILKIKEEGLEHKLPAYLHTTLIYRGSQSLRRRRLPEVVLTLNALLYREPVEIILKGNRRIVTKLEHIDVYGRAKIGEKKISMDEVEDVKPL